MRPICADALKRNAFLCENADMRFTKQFMAVAVSDIDSAPTLSPDDLRPVGKWIEVAMRIKCSVCGTDFNDEVTCCSDCYRWPWNYCPNCGAAMSEGE